MSERDVKRFGRIVADWRGRLQLTQDELATRARLGIVTVQRTEGGHVTPRGKTLTKLEQAFGWEPGTASHILHGGDPPGAPSLLANHPAPLEVGAYLRDLRAALGRDKFIQLLDEFTRSQDEVERTKQHDSAQRDLPEETG